MTRMARLILVLALFTMPSLVRAQEGDADFVPFQSEIYGIYAGVPAGWVETWPGYFVKTGLRDLSQFAALEVVRLPDVLIYQQMTWWARDLGLERFPASDESYATTAFEWELYHFDARPPELFAGQPEDLALRGVVALAEADDHSYFVRLYAPLVDYDELEAEVFWPVLDSFRLLRDDEREIVPYVQEEVTFVNDDILLAGTLTYPDTPGPHPTVILITGSGAQDRDEAVPAVMEMRPFRLLADHLTRQGMAILRYDDRGISLSTGTFAGATTADFATDVEAALDYLSTHPDINPEQIGLLGHSEGGVIAAMVAARDARVAFVISMAGTAARGDAVLLLQTELIMRASDVPEAAIAEQTARTGMILPLVMAGDWGGLAEQAPDLSAQELAQFQDPWFQFFLGHDPVEDWEQITVPVLALFGGLDMQVSAEQNAPPLEMALNRAGNEDSTVEVFPQANHFFQPAITGSVLEYGTLPQNFVQDLLPTISDWLLARVTVE